MKRTNKRKELKVIELYNLKFSIPYIKKKVSLSTDTIYQILKRNNITPKTKDLDKKSKVCVCCKEDKPLSEYYTDNRNKDKKLGRCKTCCRKWVSSKKVKSRRNKQWKTYSYKSMIELTDNYVARHLAHHSNLTPSDIRQYPELIKVTRENIKINRTIRKYGNK